MSSAKDVELPVVGRQSEMWVIEPRFGKYVTRNQGFLSYVDDVRVQIRNYLAKERPNRPLNILLAAPPGSGKSFLIKQIVKSVDSSSAPTVFEEVYVGSFDSISELYGIFQRVQTLNLQGKVPVIFFDEVDSKISGVSLYQKFLAPMRDGNYFVGKEKHTLGKCIFFFAGSTLSAEDSSRSIVDVSRGKRDALKYDDYFYDWNSSFKKSIAEDSSNSKVADFVDRLDSILRIPPIDGVFLKNELKSEYYDLIFTLILKHFPSVNLVGKRLTELLYIQFSRAGSVRLIEKIIFNSLPKISDIFEASSLTPGMFKTISDVNELQDDESAYFSLSLKEPSSK